MILDTMSIIAYVVGLILLYVCCWIFIKPLKWLLRLMLNGILGGLILAAVNFIGSFAGIHITINPLTALITGLLGVPGVVLIIILQFVLG